MKVHAGIGALQAYGAVFLCASNRSEFTYKKKSAVRAAEEHGRGLAEGSRREYVMRGANIDRMLGIPEDVKGPMTKEMKPYGSKVLVPIVGAFD